MKDSLPQYIKDFLPENLYNGITNPEIVILFVRAAGEAGADLLIQNPGVVAVGILLFQTVRMLDWSIDLL